jgi:hypothetical protein
MRPPPPAETLHLALGRPGGPERSGARRLVAGALAAVAIAVALWPGDEHVRAAFAVALVALAAAVHHRLGAPKGAVEAWLVVDAAGVRRVEGDAIAQLASWSESFGLTVFASADTTTLLFAFTTPEATRFVSACRAPDEAPFTQSILERAVTVTDSDLPSGDERALSLDDADRLLAAVAARAPRSLDRVYLSDATGEPLTLDGGEMRIGSQTIDLSAPLEWRAFLFQERGAHAASVCQATWVRQAEVEVVLVAPMPGDSGWLGSTRATYDARSVDLPRATRNALARDMRLMQASAGDPPPRELRHAIDRVFMLPMRRALDAAPRQTKARPSLLSC